MFFFFQNVARTAVFDNRDILLNVFFYMVIRREKCFFLYGD
jgi:hypothetical protein